MITFENHDCMDAMKEFPGFEKMTGESRKLTGEAVETLEKT